MPPPVERPPSPVRDGLVTIRWADLEAKLSIASGHLSVTDIDDELALRAVFPRCEIELSRVAPKGVDMASADWDALEAKDVYGVFFGLEADVTYFALVREHPEEAAKEFARKELLRAQAAAEMRRRVANSEAAAKPEPHLKLHEAVET